MDRQMETNHRLYVSDARDLSRIQNQSVDLVVTSPPYPMIEMWDELFVRLEPRIGSLLEENRGPACFQAMHEQLDPVWREL